MPTSASNRARLGKVEETARLQRNKQPHFAAVHQGASSADDSELTRGRITRRFYDDSYFPNMSRAQELFFQREHESGFDS